MQKIKLLILVLVSMSITACQNKNLTTSYEKIPKLYNNKNAVVSVTAYCASEDIKYKNKNAIGGYMKHGRTIATDWSVYPVGTVMKIDGKTYTVEDYGSACVE